MGGGRYRLGPRCDLYRRNERNLRDYNLFTTSDYAVRDRVDTSNLVQRFNPFDPALSGVPCFASDALIETANGQIPAGELQVGDLVMTRDSGLQPIRWVGSRKINAGRLATNPELRPIRISAGALGKGTPESDLVVSPQHRILVRSRIAHKMFGTDEVLVAAKQLCQVDGIEVADDITEITYVHFLFDAHQIVFANGAEAESLLVGAEALKTVGSAARAEILSLFPELADRPTEPSRVVVNGRMGRKLAIRHAQNAKPLLY